MTDDSKFRCDRIWRGARLATMAAQPIDDGVIACRDGRIIYAGAAASAPAFDAEIITQCDGRWITPGLIDCHTHLIHAGNRAGEFAQRLAGASYEEIARAGGGVVSTMNATRGDKRAAPA
jgi:imidazolonepropionase